jgi:hypothetical protein
LGWIAILVQGGYLLWGMSGLRWWHGFHILFLVERVFGLWAILCMLVVEFGEVEGASVFGGYVFGETLVYDT